MILFLILNLALVWLSDLLLRACCLDCWFCLVACLVCVWFVLYGGCLLLARVWAIGFGGFGSVLVVMLLVVIRVFVGLFTCRVRWLDALLLRFVVFECAASGLDLCVSCDWWLLVYFDFSLIVLL